MRNQKKLNKLSYQSQKNKIDLKNKESDEIKEESSQEFLATTKSLYDSGWTVCDIEKIEEATTLTYEELLPEKATYNFSKELNIPEAYLPFVRTVILARTIPEQYITGVKDFIFTSLRELSFTLYTWQGISQSIAGRGEYGGFTTAPISGPQVSLPAPALTVPPPEAAYSQTVYWSTVEVPSIGTGLGPYPVNATGTVINPGTPQEQSVADWSQDLVDTYGTDYISFVWDAAESVDFIPSPIVDFPLPTGIQADYVLPYGTSSDPDEHSTIEFPNQYWLSTEITDFDDIVTDRGYSDAVDILNTYFEDIVVTDEDAGPTYYAYEPIETETIQTCNQQKIINKLGTNRFRFDLTGHFLLISKAITETSYSHENNPTYEPNGEDMEARLIIYIDPKIETINLQEYKNEN